MKELRDKFSRIYDQNIEKIFRFIYLKVDSQETAEDITSKVFLKAWKAFCEPSFKLENESAFLYHIAKNAIIDHYREKSRNKTTSLDFSSEIADSRTNIQDMAVLSADITLIKKAIQKLDKDHQDIIIWHYLEDMPINDIAKLVSRPEGTVRVMLHRGLKKLKDIVQES